MLELKNISYSVNDDDGSKEILKNISLELSDDKFYVVTGPNGGGKSTLAKIIAGIVSPTEGKIIFDGKDITDMNVTDRAKAGISFAFQQPVRFKGITVRDLISLAAGSDVTFDKACDYLARVGLCARDYIDREVNASLSGGELKRIEIAMTLARKTKITLFDEPEAGIDLWSFSNLIKEFEKLHTDLHGMILIISHQERIINIADELILIADGELKGKGSREEILPEYEGLTMGCRITASAQ
ncbi:MAG: ATP-binding cassette domain-containing protein [Lachnospiraceae bacterium]|nr:ATP-binding cassette domain-containing protein [Lachnospiraceae bacterium]